MKETKLTPKRQQELREMRELRATVKAKKATGEKKKTPARAKPKALVAPTPAPQSPVTAICWPRESKRSWVARIEGLRGDNQYHHPFRLAFFPRHEPVFTITEPGVYWKAEPTERRHEMWLVVREGEGLRAERSDFASAIAIARRLDAGASFEQASLETDANFEAPPEWTPPEPYAVRVYVPELDECFWEAATKAEALRRNPHHAAVLVRTGTAAAWITLAEVASRKEGIAR